MMDYSNGRNENFILNFKEKGTEIIINFAHKLFKKNKLVVANTIENKNKILNAMENQVELIEEDKIFKKEKDIKKIIFLSSCMSLAFLCMLVLSVIHFTIIGMSCFAFLFSVLC